MFQSQLIEVMLCVGGRGYIRCDWETILVRLRPRESTWLDMLLAVDKGCLVRTRPVCKRREKYGINTETPNTAVLSTLLLSMLLHLVTNC